MKTMHNNVSQSGQPFPFEVKFGYFGEISSKKMRK